MHPKKGNAQNMFQECYCPIKHIKVGRQGKSTPQIFMLVQGAWPGMDAQEIFYRSHQALVCLLFLAVRMPSKMRVKLFGFLLNSQCNETKQPNVNNACRLQSQKMLVFFFF